MSLFDNVNPEKFFLYVGNFNMTLAASGRLDTGTKIQHICKLVYSYALRQFELLSSDVESMETITVVYIIMGSTVCLIAGLSKPMCNALIVNILRFKKLLTYLSRWILLNLFMKVQYNPLINNLLG